MIGAGMEANTAPNFPAKPSMLSTVVLEKKIISEFEDESPTKYGKEDHESSGNLNHSSATNASQC